MGSTYTNLLYHLVFSTKHREPLIVPEIQEDLYRYIGGIVRDQGGKLLHAGGMPDHVHLVTRLKADVSVSEMMRLIKANSSKWANEEGRQRTRFEWQVGYAAFSVSASQLEGVARYVDTQEEHHRRRPFKEELMELLRRNGIEFDERYVFD